MSRHVRLKVTNESTTDSSTLPPAVRSVPWLDVLRTFRFNRTEDEAAKFVELVALSWDSHGQDILAYNDAYANMISRIAELATAEKASLDLAHPRKVSARPGGLPSRALEPSAKQQASWPSSSHRASTPDPSSRVRSRHTNCAAAKLKSEDLVRKADDRQQASLANICALFMAWRGLDEVLQHYIQVYTQRAADHIGAWHAFLHVLDKIQRCTPLRPLQKPKFSYNETAVRGGHEWFLRLHEASRDIDGNEDLCEGYIFAKHIWQTYFDLRNTPQKRKPHDLVWTYRLESLQRNIHFLDNDFQQEPGVLKDPGYHVKLPRPWATDHLYDKTWIPGKTTSHFEGEHIEIYQDFEKLLNGPFLHLTRRLIIQSLQGLAKIWQQHTSKSYASHVTDYTNRYKNLISAVDEVYQARLLPSKQVVSTTDPRVAKIKIIAKALRSQQEGRKTVPSDLKNFWTLSRNDVTINRLSEAFVNTAHHPIGSRGRDELEKIIKGHEEVREYLSIASESESVDDFLKGMCTRGTAKLDFEMRWEHRLYRREDHERCRPEEIADAHLHKLITTIYDGIDLPCGVADVPLVRTRRTHHFSDTGTTRHHKAHVDHPAAGTLTRRHSTGAHGRSVHTARHVP